MTSVNICIYIIVQVCAYSVMSDSLRSYGLQPTRLLCSWYFLGKEVGCHFLGIVLTQGSNPCLLCLLHCRWILYGLNCRVGWRCTILYIYIYIYIYAHIYDIYMHTYMSHVFSELAYICCFLPCYFQ